MAVEVQNILKKTDAVCFDVDSTVIKEEGIDELARFCNKGDEIANLTAKAMTGTMTFQEALKLRLDILRPTLTDVKNFLKTCPPTLTPGISQLVSLLHSKNIDVFLISGGFKSIIAPIASQLNIPYNNIFANRLKFYFNGDYAGFDEDEPTSKSGGKGVVIDYLKKNRKYKNVILIGDGATDLEACPPADAFIVECYLRAHFQHCSILGFIWCDMEQKSKKRIFASIMESITLYNNILEEINNSKTRLFAT